MEKIEKLIKIEKKNKYYFYYICGNKTNIIIALL